MLNFMRVFDQCILHGGGQKCLISNSLTKITEIGLRVGVHQKFLIGLGVDDVIIVTLRPYF